MFNGVATFVMEAFNTVAATISSDFDHLRMAEWAQSLGYRWVSFFEDEDPLSVLRLCGAAVLILPMSGASGRSLHIQEQLRRQYAPVSVVCVANRPSLSSVVRAMELGAVSVLSPECSLDEFSQVLGAAGREYDKRLAWQQDTQEAQRRISQLSPRQRDVMTIVISGKTNKAIANILTISPKTVEKHRQMVHERTGTRTLPDLVHLQEVAARSPDLMYQSNPFDSAPAHPELCSLV